MALSAGLTADVQGVVDRLRALWMKSTVCADDPTGCAIPEILFFPFSENAGTLFRSIARLEAIDAAFAALLSEPLMAELADYLNEDILCWLLTQTDKPGRILPRRDDARDNDLWLNDLSDLLAVLEGLTTGDDPWCCPCPCTTWPPASWPCGGLHQTYAFGGSRKVTHTASGKTWDTRTFSGTLEATGTPCKWGGVIDVEYKVFYYDGSLARTTTEQWYFELAYVHELTIPGGLQCVWAITQAVHMQGMSRCETGPTGTYIGPEQGGRYTIPPEYLDWPDGVWDLDTAWNLIIS